MVIGCIRSGSSARRGTRGRSCCGCAPAIPSSTSSWPPATRRPAPPSPTCTRAWRAAYGDLRVRGIRPGRGRRRSTSCSCPAARRVPALVPELRGRVKHVVDLAADFRLHDPALYPQWYGEEHAAPELLADFVYGLPELFRDDIRGAALVAGRRVATRPRPRSRSRRSCGPASSSRRASSSTPPAACPAPAAASTRSAAPTRTSSPTACSTTATRPRSSRPSARRDRCSSRPTWRR